MFFLLSPLQLRLLFFPLLFLLLLVQLSDLRLCFLTELLEDGFGDTPFYHCIVAEVPGDRSGGGDGAGGSGSGCSSSGMEGAETKAC